MAKSATSFESILDTPADEVERPKPLPAGTYTAIVRGLPEYGESTKKKTPFVKFALALISADEDVDEDELTELLTNKDGEVIPLTEKSISSTYYTTPDALFRLTDFLEHCGIESEGKTVRQMIDETPNCEVKIKVAHRPSEDGQQIFAEVKGTMKVE